MPEAIDSSIWQSITTAPKDGTYFIGAVYNPVSSPGVIIGLTFYNNGTWWHKVESGYAESWSPNCWIPLPELAP